jgi:hypothetical protein
VKYYAIKRPDGSWIMETFSKCIDAAWVEGAWHSALTTDAWKAWAIAAGYTCVEVSGFVEVGK